MADPSPQTVQIQGCLDRLLGGDGATSAELLGCICEWQRNLARKMLKGYRNVRRREQTNDVLLRVSECTVKRRWQAARLRLHDALHGEVPE